MVNQLIEIPGLQVTQQSMFTLTSGTCVTTGNFCDRRYQFVNEFRGEVCGINLQTAVLQQKDFPKVSVRNKWYSILHITLENGTYLFSILAGDMIRNKNIISYAIIAVSKEDYKTFAAIENDGNDGNYTYNKSLRKTNISYQEGIGVKG